MSREYAYKISMKVDTDKFCCRLFPKQNSLLDDGRQQLADPH